MTETEAAQCLYSIDASDVIVRVGGDWLDFAGANQAAESCHPDQVLGRPLWNFVTGLETRHLYRLLLDGVRSGREALRIPFRCDAPDRRRFLELIISRQPEGLLQFASVLLRVEPRLPVSALEPDLPKGEELLRMCSLCKRVEGAPGSWVEVEMALVALQPFNAEFPPAITHGVCPDCERNARELLFDHL